MNNLVPFRVNRRRCPFPTTSSSRRHLSAHSLSALSYSDLFLPLLNSELSAAGHQLTVSFFSPFNFKPSTLNLFLSRRAARACFPPHAVGYQLSAVSPS